MTKGLSFADLRKMKRGTNASEEFLFPFNKEVSYSIRVLTQDEILKSNSLGRKYAKELVGDSENIPSDYITELSTRQLLKRAVYTVEDDENKKAPFFATADEVGELTADETNVILEQYNEVQEKYAPVKAIKTEADFSEMIDAIKKKSVYGMSLNSYTLRELVSYMVVNMEKLPKDNGTASLDSKVKEENTKKKQGTKQKVELRLEEK